MSEIKKEDFIIKFKFKDVQIFPNLTVYNEDLLRPTDTMDSLFNPFFIETILDAKSANMEDSYFIDFSLFTVFDNVDITDITSVLRVYVTLYDSVYRLLKLPNRIGEFTAEELLKTRNFFLSMSNEQKSILITITDILGNERLLDCLSKLYAEFIAGKTETEIKKIIG